MLGRLHRHFLVSADPHRVCVCVYISLFEVTLRDFHDEVIAGLSLANAPIRSTMIDDLGLSLGRVYVTNPRMSSL